MIHHIQRGRRSTGINIHTVGIAIVVLIFTGCSFIPVEHRPDINLPSKFAESDERIFTPLLPAEDPGQWRPAEPADIQHPSPWWQIFGDPVLMSLEEEALRENPEVSIAMSRLKQARALTSRSKSERFPDINAGFGPTRQRTSGAEAGRGDGSPGTTQTLWRAQASVAYEADIFGRVASNISAVQADAAQQQALSHQMLLLVQSDVARTYFSLRQLKGELELMRATVKLREDAAMLLDQKLAVGSIARYVVDQAKAELFSARSEQLVLEQQFGLVSHALATLLGKTSMKFLDEVKPLDIVSVQLPPGLPSSLLERRPDIAAAERAMAAENSRIGVARAAFFPALSLTGSMGYESSDLGNLFNWSQRTFLLGPLVGTALSMPIFDGGRRKADIASARARYEERVAEYRKTVLQAFREVEDSLVSIRTLDGRIIHLQSAVESSSSSAISAKARFDEGDADYLLVVDAERTRLRNRQSLIQSEGERARATVDLLLSLGGGWQSHKAQALNTAH